MKYRLPFVVLFGLLVLGISGCTTKYPVRVDALNSGAMDGAGENFTYTLASDTPGVEASELFFKEVSRFLGPILENQGYRAATSPETAEVLISVDAHLSEPMVETESYSEPICVETRGYMRSVRIPIVSQSGEVVGFSYASHWVPSHTTQAGWIDRDRQITVYDKVLRLSARQVLGVGNYSDEVWAISITLRNDSTDYRSALPYMLVAGAPYIGKRTDGEEVILINEDNEDVIDFKAGL